MTTTILDPPRVTDPRAVGALPDASAEVADLWARATAVAAGELPVMGLAAGDRPCADVDVLASAFAVVEYEVARRMDAATRAGSLPLVGPGAVLAARGWAGPHARRLARTGALAADHPSIAAAWAAGVITSEHVDAVARKAGLFSAQELAVVIGELAAHWGQWSPPAIARFVAAAARMLHPPDDPTPDEADAYACRDLSFALYGDTVLLSGTLPRLEGEAVIAAIDAWAEKLRTTADHIPAGARRADALVELVNNAAATGSLPTRGGLPVSLTVTLNHTSVGDPNWTTSRRHHLTPAEQRFTSCDPTLTPLLLHTPGSGGTHDGCLGADANNTGRRSGAAGAAAGVGGSGSGSGSGGGSGGGGGGGGGGGMGSGMYGNSGSMGSGDMKRTQTRAQSRDGSQSGDAQRVQNREENRRQNREQLNTGAPAAE